MSTNEIRVPDIGDFKNVPVIEIHVKAGQVIKADDPLVSLESDKATMEVPAPRASRVVEVKVQLGDKVSEGTIIVLLEAAGVGAGAATAPAAAASAARAAVAPAPTAAKHSGGGRHRVRSARSWGWTRRLFGSLPCCRP